METLHNLVLLVQMMYKVFASTPITAICGIAIIAQIAIPLLKRTR